VLRASRRKRVPGLPLYVDSAGTANYHVGEPPDRRTIAAARRRGYELAALRARQIAPADFSGFDYVLAMDRANLDELARLRTAGCARARGSVPGVRARTGVRRSAGSLTTEEPKTSNACWTCASRARALLRRSAAPLRCGSVRRAAHGSCIS
jgi:protein-tyrosine-phosphatase